MSGGRERIRFAARALRDSRRSGPSDRRRTGLASSPVAAVALVAEPGVFGPQKISSGSQMSGRPKPKPNVLNPIDSMATLPAKTSRSAQEIFRPYFFLIGQSSRRALSRFALSGQLLSGAKRCCAVAATAAAVGDAVGAGGVPRHADEERPVVAVVGRPPVLRGGHHLDEVPLQRLDVEGLELSRVIEVLAPSGWTGASAGGAPTGRADSATSPGSSWAGSEQYDESVG